MILKSFLLTLLIALTTLTVIGVVIAFVELNNYVKKKYNKNIVENVVAVLITFGLLWFFVHISML